MNIDGLQQIPGSGTSNLSNELVSTLPSGLGKWEGRQVQLVQHDGDNAPGVYVVQAGKWVASGSGSAYDVAYFAPTDFALEGVVLAFTATRNVEFAAGFAGSYAKLAAAVTTSTSLSVKKNGVSVGTVSFGAGAAVGTFNAASAVSLAAGDTLTISVIEAATNASGFSCTLKGTAV